MSNDLDHTTYGTGALISDGAARGKRKRPPRARPGDGAKAPVSGQTKLRRWSVAELIARAVARPSAAGVAH